MQRVARLKRELKMFQESPPFGVSCWAKEDSLEELEARKNYCSTCQHVHHRAHDMVVDSWVMGIHGDLFSPINPPSDSWGFQDQGWR